MSMPDSSMESKHEPQGVDGAVLGPALELLHTGLPALKSCTGPPPGIADPFTLELFQQAALDRKSGQPPLLPDLVLHEVPLQTPVSEAHHGTAWLCLLVAVPHGNYYTVRCLCWKQKNEYLADRIVVKLFYEKDRIVSEDVAYETDVQHPEHSLLPRFDQ